MASFCLPREYRTLFLNALKDRKIDPADMATKTSAERRAIFSDILRAGSTAPEEVSATDALAHEVNALFEEKLLKKNQKAAMIEWAKSLTGVRPEVRADISAKIQQMERVLSPEDEKSFLEDLAAKRLNVSVTHEEAQKIFKMSDMTERLKDIWDQDPTNDLKRRAYGNALIDLRDQIEDMKPDGHTYTDIVLNIVGIPKALNTSILHFSGPMVQAYGLIGTKSWWRGLPKMIEYFRDESNYKNLQADIITSPYYEKAVNGGLRLTDISSRLSSREEALQSIYIQKLNDMIAEKSGLPINLVGASSRAFTGYLNFVRFDRFKTLVDAATLANEDVELGSENLHDLAKTVNDFTGGAELGYRDKYRNIAKATNAIFYAPRKLIATGEMFNPWRYIDPSISATVRKARFSQLFGTLAATATILSLAKLSGANIDLNLVSTGFLTAEFHGERFDVTGGYAKFIRFMAQAGLGRQVSNTGRITDVGVGYKPLSRAEIVGKFIRGKTSPTAGALWDVMANMKMMTGQPVTASGEAQQRLEPIFFNSAIEYLYNNPDHTANVLPVVAAFLGISVESPLPKVNKFGMTPWGQQASTSFGH